ncbi:MAG: 1-deoxy-D-xylulose-5-phosphate reductoisomerase [Mycoplasmoidaceae bacterium]
MRILILGATGSIGLQTIEVIKNFQELQLVGFSFFKNIEKAKQILSLFPNASTYSDNIITLNDCNSYDELIKKTKPEIILNAITGFAGLEKSIICLKNKINLVLANKESMVVAGKFLIQLANKNNVSIIPVDSEISSIFSLIKLKQKNIKKIIITASGGKFFNNKKLDKSNYKFNEVIKHPKWDMGEKISIDSSTMINKYFEIIEASYFFPFEIDVIQHKEAIVHSIVEYLDGSSIMYLSEPDMKIAIQNAIFNFDSWIQIINKLNYDKLNLTFNKINENKWLPIKWGKEFLNNKNLAQPVIINAANDSLFNLFKEDKINFHKITLIIEQAITKFNDYKINKIEDVFLLNDIVRKWIEEKKYE